MAGCTLETWEDTISMTSCTSREELKVKTLSHFSSCWSYVFESDSLAIVLNTRAAAVTFQSSSLITFVVVLPVKLVQQRDVVMGTRGQAFNLLYFRKVFNLFKVGTYTAL